MHFFLILASLFVQGLGFFVFFCVLSVVTTPHLQCGNVFGCVHLSVAPLISENLDLQSSFLVCRYWYVFRMVRSNSYIRSSGQGQGLRSKKVRLYNPFASGLLSIEKQSCL